MPLYVHLTSYTVHLDSDNETECFIGRGRDSYPNRHSYSCRSLPRFSNVLTKSPKTICSLMAISDGMLIIPSKSIIRSKIYKKLLFIILITFTSTQRSAKKIPISYLVGRAVVQPSFKPFPNGFVHFKIWWSNFVPKLATVMSF